MERPVRQARPAADDPRQRTRSGDPAATRQTATERARIPATGSNQPPAVPARRHCRISKCARTEGFRHDATKNRAENPLRHGPVERPNALENRLFPRTIMTLAGVFHPEILTVSPNDCPTLGTLPMSRFNNRKTMPAPPSGVCLATGRPLWHNGSQLLDIAEKVPMAGAKGSFPCQFYPLEERLHEQKARRCRRRGRACRPAGCASANRERHAVRSRSTLTWKFVNGKHRHRTCPAGDLHDATVQLQHDQSDCIRVSSNSSRLGRARHANRWAVDCTRSSRSNRRVNPAQSGGTLAGRETFVGLQGGWGTFKMGHFLTPYDDIHPIFGNVPTLTTSILSTASLWAQGFAVDEHRRLRRSRRELDALRLAEHVRLHFEIQYGQQGTNYARPGRRRSRRRRVKQRVRSSARPRSTTTARSRSASRTPATTSVRGRQNRRTPTGTT